MRKQGIRVMVLALLMALVAVAVVAYQERQLGLERVAKAEAQTERETLAWQLVLAEDRVVNLEFSYSEQREAVRILESEREQIILDLEEEKQRVSALRVANANFENGIRVMEGERVRLFEESDRQETEIEVLSNFLVRLATNQQDRSYEVVPICFAPSDLSPCSVELVGEIGSAMAEVQAWYYQYVSKTFTWSPAIIIQGEHPSSWYYDPKEPTLTLCEGKFCERILAEVGPRILSGYSAQTRDTIYITFFTGEWPWAVGLTRFPILGGWVTSNLTAVKDLASRQSALGTIAHELGHALGVYDHNTVPDSVMWKYADSGNIFGGFSEGELGILGGSPFLK